VDFASCIGYSGCRCISCKKLISFDETVWANKGHSQEINPENLIFQPMKRHKFHLFGIMELFQRHLIQSRGIYAFIFLYKFEIN